MSDWMHFRVRKYSDFILRSAIPDVTIPTVSLMEELQKNTSKWMNHTALECGITGRSYTHSQVWDSAQRFGNALEKLGLCPKDVLAIISPNNPELGIATLGTMNMGGIVTAVNQTLTAEEMARHLQNCDTKYLLTVPSLMPVIKKIRDIYKGIQKVIVVGESDENCIKFSDMLKEDGGTSGRALDVDVHDTAIILSSSGTTGLPKGVMLTHYNLVSVNRIWEGLKLYSETKGSFQEVFNCVIPLYHIFGLVAILFLGLSHGVKIVTLPGFEPTSFVKALDQHRPTVLHLVTPMFPFLADYPGVKDEHFENIHTLIYGGSPTGMSLINRLKKRMHPAAPKFVEAYGMTEFVPITANPKDNFVLGSCGKTIPNTKVKIVDTKTGSILGPNQTGELCVQGPQMMKGYLKNPEATAATIKDGWLHTGDVAYYDDNEFIFIVDRVKELIKVKAFQVAPSELEDLLRKHPAVKDAAVIGIPDEIVGELPRAYVVITDTKVTEEEIRKYANDNVAPHKKLTGGVIFVDAIPRSPTGKILRKELKRKALSEL